MGGIDLLRGQKKRALSSALMGGALGGLAGAGAGHLAGVGRSAGAGPGVVNQISEGMSQVGKNLSMEGDATLRAQGGNLPAKGIADDTTQVRPNTLRQSIGNQFLNATDSAPGANDAGQNLVNSAANVGSIASIGTGRIPFSFKGGLGINGLKAGTGAAHGYNLLNAYQHTRDMFNNPHGAPGSTVDRMGGYAQMIKHPFSTLGTLLNGEVPGQP